MKRISKILKRWFPLFSERKEVVGEFYYPRDNFMVLGGAGSGKQTRIFALRNTLVLGGAGSGKTASIGKPIMEQFIQHGWAGFIYDYKDYDYTKTAWNLVQKHGYPHKFYYVNFTDMNRTYRFNILDKRVITTEAALLQALDDFMNAMKPPDGKKDDWMQAALGLLKGVAVRFFHFQGEYARYCTLPHILNFILMATPKELTTFLQNDLMAMKMAGGFLGSAGSDRTQSSIIFTLNNMLANLATNKNICYVLTGDDFVFDLVDPEDPKLFAVSNNFALESIISPIIAMLVPIAARKIEFGNRVKFAFLLDEMTTFKVNNFQSLPSILYPYSVAFFLLVGSIEKLVRIYGKSGVAAISASFDCYFLGKTLETVDLNLYESFFKDSNIAIPKSLSPGEFIRVYQDNPPEKCRLQKIVLDEKPLPVVKLTTSREIEQNYTQIEMDCERLLRDLEL